MSPDAITADRVYRDLKRQIMVGELRPGANLILTHIAENSGTSVSPVRDAILRMVGERLVETHSGGGFSVPDITREHIIHYYRWHADLVRVMIRAIDGPADVGLLPDNPGLLDKRDKARVADLTDELFLRIARCSPNPEHRHAIACLSARLHVVRIHEVVLPRLHAELKSLWAMVGSGNRHSIRSALWHYHRRRLSNVDAIFEAFGSSGVNDDDAE